jgi:hypothetical protein
MTITNDIIMMGVNIIIILGVFLRLENRLTKLETTQDLLVKLLIKDGMIDRRGSDS